MKHLFVFIFFLFAQTAFSFNSLTHEQITKSAFFYLKDHPHLSPHTQDWLDLGSVERNLLERLLVRQVVDTDYRDDVWLKTFFHDSFTGAIQANDEPIVMVTMYLHFINMTKPGNPWPYHNGYSYDATDTEDNDGILGTSFLELSMGKSAAFGGKHDNFPLTGPDYGDLKLGYFLEDEPKLYSLRQLNAMHVTIDPEKIVFPPATVPAQMAYDKVVSSHRYVAREPKKEIWNHILPLFPGRSVSEIVGAIFSDANVKYRHSYWRAQIPGLPDKLDLLGVTIHLAQDLSMPHHTLATSNYCHAEFEEAVDILACGSQSPPPYYVYDAGTFDQGPGCFRLCQNLYDPDLVTQIMHDPEFLEPGAQQPFCPDRNFRIEDRLRSIAKFTSAWYWDFDEQKDKFRTYLPQKRYQNGKTWIDRYIRGPIRHSKCSHFWTNPDIVEQMKIQYNVAVAATVMIIEHAARDFEDRFE
ncbi:MAG: hypothetical protein AB7F43_04985 [Bacteriovoracia bacterium]